MTSPSKAVLRVGIGGLGVGATVMMSEVAIHPRVKIVAGADPRPVARQKFEAQFGAKTFDSVEAMSESPDLDLVYIMTPSRMHAQEALIAAVPGEGFGAPGFIRLSFAASLPTIDEALQRLATWLEKRRR